MERLGKTLEEEIDFQQNWKKVQEGVRREDYPINSLPKNSSKVPGMSNVDTVADGSREGGHKEITREEVVTAELRRWQDDSDAFARLREAWLSE